MPSKRGAPSHNLNALKHGFYSKKFRPAEVTELEKTDFTGLAEEIKLLRLYIRRVVDLDQHTGSLDQALDILRTLCLASVSLDRLIKTQHMLAGGQTELTRQILEATAQTSAEWEAVANQSGFSWQEPGAPPPRP